MSTGGAEAAGAPSRTPADRARFESLVGEVHLPLMRFLRRRTDPDTAEDVLADTLLVLWRRIADVPEESPLPWCYGVARGCLANTQRSRARQSRLIQRLAQHLPRAGSESQAGGIPQGSGDPELALALAGLPARDREVLHLWAWEELAPAEIATVLGISANAASIRLHRAKVRLRSRLAGPGGKTRGAAGHSLASTETEAPT